MKLSCPHSNTPDVIAWQWCVCVGVMVFFLSQALNQTLLQCRTESYEAVKLPGCGVQRGFIFTLEFCYCGLQSIACEMEKPLFAK